MLISESLLNYSIENATSILNFPYCCTSFYYKIHVIQVNLYKRREGRGVYISNLIDVSNADTKYRIFSDNYINSSHPKYTANNSIKFNTGQTSFDYRSRDINLRHSKRAFDKFILNTFEEGRPCCLSSRTSS